MPVQTHSRPELKAPVQFLLSEIVPAVKSGGQVPLVDLVEAVAGDRLSDKVRKQIQERGSASFRVAEGGEGSYFENEGPAIKIALKRFDIKIPRRVSGYSRLVDDGVVLRFEGSETLSATKLFFSVKLESLEVTSRRIYIDMEGDTFDQSYELG
jgi:hypothetical protein